MIPVHMLTAAAAVAAAVAAAATAAAAAVPAAANNMILQRNQRIEDSKEELRMKLMIRKEPVDKIRPKEGIRIQSQEGRKERLKKMIAMTIVMITQMIRTTNHSPK